MKPISALFSILLHFASFTAHGETSSFTLVNALTDTDIEPLNDGDVINLAALPTKKLNIRFETNMVIGSVLFDRNGRHVRTENAAPYAMAGDESAGNYSIWTPVVGEYEVCATPYSGYGGKGIRGETKCVRFTVVNISSGITHLTLVNADTDEDIQNLHQGAVIDLAMLPTTNLNIRANTYPPVVGSLLFIYNEISDDVTNVDNVAPYALFDDNNGDYFAGNILPCEECYINAAAFSEADYGGDELSRLFITFTFINSASSKMSESEQIEAELNTGERQPYPNPNQGLFNVAFSVKEITNVKAEIFDMLGNTIFREELLSFSGAYQRQLDLSRYPHGVYLLRVNYGESTIVRKVVISER